MMIKVILTLAASLLAGAALAQSGAKVHASAATDAVKPPPASATSHASAATDAPRLIPQARKSKQPASEAGKPVK
ncbi:hypothetical protein [Janthinobacterium sp. DSP2-3-3]|uniref:hypothetical protein n=1 Tax=Janthinobacterium sp. DSP2-3-3 TaxID=2804596 RepID=UPI003CECDC22